MADETETREQQQVDTPEVAPAQPIAVRAQPKAPLEAQAAGVLPIVPTNIDEAQRYAQGLIAAGIVPDSFKFSKNVLWTPEEIEAGAIGVKHREGTINAPLVLMGVLKSMEIGVAPQTGLAGLLPLNGRFAVWGDLAAGLVQRGGQVANHIDRRIGPAFDPNTPLGEWPEEYGWTVSYWRTGQPDPYIGTFTVRDAKRANLWMNTRRDPWIKYPDRMLFNRARAFALRDGFADALMGLSIAEEVLDAMPAVDEPKQIESKRSLLTDDEPDRAPEQAEEAPTEPAQDEEGGERPQEGGEQLPLA